MDKIEQVKKILDLWLDYSRSSSDGFYERLFQQNSLAQQIDALYKPVSTATTYTDAEVKCLVADAHFKAIQQTYREIGEWLEELCTEPHSAGFHRFRKDCPVCFAQLKSGRMPKE
jgi:hypothetical protein